MGRPRRFAIEVIAGLDPRFHFPFKDMRAWTCSTRSGNDNRVDWHMTDDERAIRNLVATWMAASQAGDVETVLGLMTDDVIFMTLGREPFGKAFAAASEAMKGVRMEGTSEIRELKVLDGWAYLRNHIDVAITAPGGQPIRRAGYTLTILRKDDGHWRIARDANLLAQRT